MLKVFADEVKPTCVIVAKEVIHHVQILKARSTSIVLLIPDVFVITTRI